MDKKALAKTLAASGKAVQELINVQLLLTEMQTELLSADIEKPQELTRIEGCSVWVSPNKNVIGISIQEHLPRLQFQWAEYPTGQIYKNVRDHWKKLIQGILYRAKQLNVPMPQLPFDNVLVLFKLKYDSDIARDVDNHIYKMVIDPLKTAGLIKEDNFKVMSFASLGERTETPGLEIWLINNGLDMMKSFFHEISSGAIEHKVT